MTKLTNELAQTQDNEQRTAILESLNTAELKTFAENEFIPVNKRLGHKKLIAELVNTIAARFKQIDTGEDIYIPGLMGLPTMIDTQLIKARKDFNNAKKSATPAVIEIAPGKFQEIECIEIEDDEQEINEEPLTEEGLTELTNLWKNGGLLNTGNSRRTHKAKSARKPFRLKEDPNAVYFYNNPPEPEAVKTENNEATPAPVKKSITKKYESDEDASESAELAIKDLAKVDTPEEMRSILNKLTHRAIEYIAIKENINFSCPPAHKRSKQNLIDGIINTITKRNKRIDAGEELIIMHGVKLTPLVTARYVKNNNSEFVKKINLSYIRAMGMACGLDPHESFRILLEIYEIDTPYFDEEYYSDTFGDNSHPEQDIPEDHEPDTATAPKNNKSITNISVQKKLAQTDTTEQRIRILQNLSIETLYKLAEKEFIKIDKRLSKEKLIIKIAEEIEWRFEEADEGKEIYIGLNKSIAQIDSPLINYRKEYINVKNKISVQSPETAPQPEPKPETAPAQEAEKLTQPEPEHKKFSFVIDRKYEITNHSHYSFTTSVYRVVSRTAKTVKLAYISERTGKEEEPRTYKIFIDPGYQWDTEYVKINGRKLTARNEEYTTQPAQVTTPTAQPKQEKITLQNPEFSNLTGSKTENINIWNKIRRENSELINACKTAEEMTYLICTLKVCTHIYIQMEYDRITPYNRPRVADNSDVRPLAEFYAQEIIKRRERKNAKSVQTQEQEAKPAIPAQPVKPAKSKTRKQDTDTRVFQEIIRDLDALTPEKIISDQDKLNILCEDLCAVLSGMKKAQILEFAAQHKISLLSLQHFKKKAIKDIAGYICKKLAMLKSIEAQQALTPKTNKPVEPQISHVARTSEPSKSNHAPTCIFGGQVILILEGDNYLFDFESEAA